MIRSITKHIHHLLLYFVSTAFITNIKNVKKKKINSQFSNSSHPSLLPTQLLTHFVRASSKLNLFTAIFTGNNQCQGCRGRRLEEGNSTVAKFPHRKTKWRFTKFK